MRNESSKILTKNEINKLRKAYNNKKIADEYLIFDVRNIMKCEGITKEQALNNILRLVNN